MLLLNVLYWLGLGTTVVTAHGFDAQLRSQLSNDAQIYYPNDSDWTTALQQRWTNWSAPTYRAAVKVATVEDVQAVVRFAGQHNIPFLATSKGHAATQTLGAVRNGLDIDISSINYTRYDPATTLLTVGGSVRNAQIWDALQPYGRQMATAAAPCVGVMGATLGAGVGTLSGLWGFTVDALHSVRIVTADGCLVNASATQNPDLFWAIRGAGHNFGIVTEATFTTHPAIFGSKVSEADMAFPAAANASIWSVLQSFDRYIDPKLTLTVVTSYNHTIGQIVLLVNAVYYGPNATMAGYLKPFLALKPVQTQFNVVPWKQLADTLYFGNDGSSCETNLHLNFGGNGARKTTVADYVQFSSDFASLNKQYPNLTASLSVFRYSTQGPQSFPANSTAYPYRDMTNYLLFEAIYPDVPGMDQKIDSFIVQTRKKFQAGTGYSNLTLYLNYGHGDEGPEVWYSAARLPRLSRLKQKWDPDSRFSFYNPVPQKFP